MPTAPAIFTLVPSNAKAQKIVESRKNAQHRSNLHGIRKGLDVTPATGRRRHILATIGRAGCDITIEGAATSQFQCEFEVFPSGTIILRDRSSKNSTEVTGENSVPFRLGGTREVVVSPYMNTEFGMGFCGDVVPGPSGRTRDGYEVTFKLVWWFFTPEDVKRVIEVFYSNGTEDSSTARTKSNSLAPPEDPSRATRINTPRILNMDIIRIEQSTLLRLGHGSYGSVFKATDIDSGKVYALKRIQIKSKGFESIQARREQWEKTLHSAKREASIQFKLHHENVLPLLKFEEREKEAVIDIFTELMDGTVESLIPILRAQTLIIQQLLRNMLSALEYLSSKSVIHRDVKPENILYRRARNGCYIFQLADFGLSRYINDAKLSEGTPIFKAPEVELRKKQTPKSDVWSLFVTMVYILDIEGFWSNWMHMGKPEDRWQLMERASKRELDMLAGMAQFYPEQRLTAKEMLKVLSQRPGNSAQRPEPQHLRGTPQPKMLATGTNKKNVTQKSSSIQCPSCFKIRQHARGCPLTTTVSTNVALRGRSSGPMDLD